MNSKKIGQKFEKKCRKRGMKLTKNSGSMFHQKGDARYGRFFVECKSTEKKQYILKEGDINKTWRHADIEGLYPAIVLDLNGRELVIIDLEILDAIKGLDFL